MPRRGESGFLLLTGSPWRDMAYEEGRAMYDEFDDFDRLEFADPGGRSALRAASRSNPRNLPCPVCLVPNRLTPRDKQLGYQCDPCADRAEGLLPEW